MSDSNSVRRLFLVAGYDAPGHVDASLVYYVRNLSKYGDVVVHMDNDCTDGSIDKLKPYVIHACAARHGEYDFGSYRRAYTYARDAGILSDYDFVYMANDSVYGPVCDLGAALHDMESKNWDAFGIVCNPNRDHPHIQSWFIGMRKTVFMTKWFDTFMMSITRQSSKGMITKLYEQGFTKLVTSHGGRVGCIYSIPNRGVYNRIKYLYRKKMPFIKKVAFPRHNGRLGRQLLYVLNRVPADARAAILENARRTYGAEYVDKTLTRNPFRIMARSMRYAINKIFAGRL